MWDRMLKIRTEADACIGKVRSLKLWRIALQRNLSTIILELENTTTSVTSHTTTPMLKMSKISLLSGTNADCLPRRAMLTTFTCARYFF